MQNQYWVLTICVIKFEIFNIRTGPLTDKVNVIDLGHIDAISCIETGQLCKINKLSETPVAHFTDMDWPIVVQGSVIESIYLYGCKYSLMAVKFNGELTELKSGHG